MRFRIYDFKRLKTIYSTNSIIDMILYFNTQNEDWDNCLMQVLDRETHRYISIGRNFN